MKRIIIVLAILCLLIAGCTKNTIKTEGNNNVDTTGDITVQPAIGMKMAIDEGDFTDKYFYNPNSKTWWIDLKMKPEFENKLCNPACVIFEDTKAVEINWRCTGAIAPDEKPICEDKCKDGTCQEIVCMAEGCPCAESAATCPEDCAPVEPGNYEASAKNAVLEYVKTIEEYKDNNGENPKVINAIAFKCEGCFQVDVEFDIGASKKGEVAAMTGPFDLSANKVEPLKVVSYEFKEIELVEVTLNECTAAGGRSISLAVGCGGGEENAGAISGTGGKNICCAPRS